jgi:hypothetical protein
MGKIVNIARIHRSGCYVTGLVPAEQAVPGATPAVQAPVPAATPSVQSVAALDPAVQ